MNDNKMERSEIMEKESPKTETGEMTSETSIEAAEDVIVEAGAVCDGADEIIVDEQAEGGEDTLVEEAAAPAKKGLRKRSIALIAAIVCLLAVAVGGTYAYYTASEQTINVISMRGLDLVLHEVIDDEGTPFKDVNGVMPGNSVPKIVYVENYLAPEEEETPEVKADFFTRIGLTMRVTNEEETEEFSAGEYGKYISIGYNGEPGHNKTDWQYNEEDGYYYYIKNGGVVKPGEVTTPLFTYVSFDKTMPNEYQNCKVFIDIEANATQSKNNKPNPLEAAW